MVSISVLSFLVIYFQKVNFAAPPSDTRPEHVAQSFEWGLVIGLNIAIAIIMWVLM